jgi:hypothetical protein
VATDDSTRSTAGGRKPGKVTAYERVVEGESYRQRQNPPSPNFSTEPAQTDAVVMKKYAPGHSSSILWWLLEDFAQPVELDLVFKTRVIHLAVSLAAIC